MICSRCHLPKPDSEARGKRRWCKSCRAAYNRIWRLANADRVKANKTAYKHSHAEAIRAYQRAYQKAYAKTHPRVTMPIDDTL